MAQYASYKPSGTPWIGDIPSHWEVKPIKTVGRFCKGLTFTKANLVDDGVAVISYGQIHSKINNSVGLNDELMRYIPAEISRNQKNAKVDNGDFIFADTSEDLEGCGNHVLIENRGFDMYGGYHTIILHCMANQGGRFLSYLFKTDYWRGQIRAKVSGVKVYSITRQILSSTSILVPPLHERQAIANYLDKKCGSIDKVIATQERRIALLSELKQSIITEAVTRGLNPDVPLKDSGIDWIGQIPEHWERCRFKNFMALITTSSTSDCKIGLENIESCSGKFIETFSEFDGNGTYFKAGHIVYGKLRPYLRKVWLAEFEGNAVGDFFVFEAKPNTISSFVKYLLLSDGFTQIATGSTEGAKMPRVSSEAILSLSYCLPPLEEQCAIVNHLDRKCSRIASAIAKAKREIELLREFKQSVITEAVTGKIKVC